VVIFSFGGFNLFTANLANLAVSLIDSRFIVFIEEALRVQTDAGLLNEMVSPSLVMIENCCSRR